jgi:hypothetical protein
MLALMDEYVYAKKIGACPSLEAWCGGGVFSSSAPIDELANYKENAAIAIARFKEMAPGESEESYSAMYRVVQSNLLYAKSTIIRDLSYGVGLWPVGAKINHSCDPNCIEIVAYGRLFLIALRSIEEGEELTIHYGVHRGPRFLTRDALALSAPGTKAIETLRAFNAFECACGIHEKEDDAVSESELGFQFSWLRHGTDVFEVGTRGEIPDVSSVSLHQDAEKAKGLREKLETETDEKAKAVIEKLVAEIEKNVASDKKRLDTWHKEVDEREAKWLGHCTRVQQMYLSMVDDMIVEGAMLTPSKIIDDRRKTLKALVRELHSIFSMANPRKFDVVLILGTYPIVQIIAAFVMEIVLRGNNHEAQKRALEKKKREAERRETGDDDDEEAEAEVDPKAEAEADPKAEAEPEPEPEPEPDFDPDTFAVVYALCSSVMRHISARTSGSQRTFDRATTEIMCICAVGAPICQNFLKRRFLDDETCLQYFGATYPPNFGPFYWTQMVLPCMFSDVASAAMTLLISHSALLLHPDRAEKIAACMKSIEKGETETEGGQPKKKAKGPTQAERRQKKADERRRERREQVERNAQRFEVTPEVEQQIDQFHEKWNEGGGGGGGGGKKKAKAKKPAKK